MMGFEKEVTLTVKLHIYKSINLKQARIALNQQEIKPKKNEKINDLMLRLTGVDITRCPRCGSGRLNIVTSLLSKWIIHSGDPPTELAVI